MTKVNIETLRAFICLEMPKDVRRAIDESATAVLKQTGVKCSWVKPDNIHLTLKFLGDIRTDRTEKIAAAVGKSCSGVEPIELFIGRVGSFGGKAPRVVWVGIEGEVERLSELAESIDGSLSLIGFERDKRRFSPHLTIARVRNPTGAERLREAITSIHLSEIRFVADKITLMRSVLSPGGSIYTRLAEFEF